MLAKFIKKFFIVAIFLSFVNCQITFAANRDIPIDWSKVQKISSKSDLAKYLEESKRKGQNMIPVILVNGLTINREEFLQLCPSSLVADKIIYNDGQITRVIYETTEYPGTKVANAYLSGNTSMLNQDEIKLYNIAVKIIDEANKRSNWQQKEIYIYDEIARRVTYQSVQDFSHQPRPCTAIGAFLDGKANCQGYSDAFYMLGRMLGWNVGRMSGTAGGREHVWNTITFSKTNEERTYCVDVTWGDSKISFGGEVNKTFNAYYYFNAPVEIMQATHSWRADLAPKNIQGSIDDMYAYGAYTNLARASNAESGLKILAKKIAKENNTYASVIFPYNEKYSKNPANYAYFKTAINNLGFQKKWWTWTQKHGKYIFVTAVVY